MFATSQTSDISMISKGIIKNPIYEEATSPYNIALFSMNRISNVDKLLLTIEDEFESKKLVTSCFSSRGATDAFFVRIIRKNYTSRLGW